MTKEAATMSDHTAFRRAIEAKSLDALLGVFREDAVLHSPITFQPFEGKASIRRLLGIIMDVFEDFRYTDELDDADGMTKILVFRTRVQGRDVEGIDLVRFDDAGLVRDLTVMVRPRSGLERLLAEVQPRLMAAIQADAG
jgi:ketosteroid isomerase-like protein